jgi:lipopolysaccharide/colanic/teichoic acid biosynthesis glycosyltransferase
MFHPPATSIRQMSFAASDLVLQPISYRGGYRHLPVMPAAACAGWPGTVKRVIDIVLASVFLLIYLVPMAVAAALIKLDSPGPVLFRQRRVGQNNEIFELLKFRTMRHHPPESGRLRQATEHDPRVTRIGAWLRRSSFDELPQLLNVLRGDMSLVGPRPHAPGTCAGGVPFELVSDCYALRHHVRPGMTGLAQVRGWRGPTDTREKLLGRLECDLEYIETWTPTTDLLILARTVVTVLGRRNAC